MKNKENKTIDVTPAAEQQQMSVVRRESQPLSVTQVQAGLDAIHQVMKQCMAEGQDFGKVPGCGDKPSLFQPGAQKLSMMFQLNPEVKEEIVTDYQNMHRGYRLVVRVTNGQKFAEGVGECSTLESKYRYKTASKKCPKCGKPTIFKSKNTGEGWYCWAKRGGCGATFVPNDPTITSQHEGKTEHDNPPDFWNTARKMAFKRGFVHAIINATNTSELWSQDLEDLASNSAVTVEEPPPPPPPRQQPANVTQMPRPAAAPAAAPKSAPSPELLRRRFLERMGQYKEIAVDFFREIGVLMPNEVMEDFPQESIPTTKESFDRISGDIEKFYQANREKYDTGKPEPKIDAVNADAPDAPWRGFPVPFGKHSGVQLGKLAKNALYGFWANFKVETTYNGKPKKPATIERDQVFRSMLDQAGLHYKFDQPQDQRPPSTQSQDDADSDPFGNEEPQDLIP